MLLSKNRATELPRFPVVTRHNAMHEFVEHGNGECGIAMMGAPDHTFGDQLVPCRTEGGHISAQLIGDIT